MQLPVILAGAVILGVDLYLTCVMETVNDKWYGAAIALFSIISCVLFVMLSVDTVRINNTAVGLGLILIQTGLVFTIAKLMETPDDRMRAIGIMIGTCMCGVVILFLAVHIGHQARTNVLVDLRQRLARADSALGL